MKKTALYISILTLILAAPLGAFALTDDGDNNVQLNVIGCNNNALCEANLGENAANCPIDCGTATTPPGGGGAPGTGGGGYNSSLEFYDVSATPGYDDATISWKTKTNALTTFSWGLSPDYEMGSVSEVGFIKIHQIKIENLKEGTIYYYRINGKDASGATATITGSFTTTYPPDLTPPSNVTNLTLTQFEKKNVLKWVNPTDPDFAFVRILRSTKTYPSDILSGRIVYEGGGNYVNDDYIDPNTIYYYTVFASDKNGNFSSGATVVSHLLPGSGSQGPATSTVPTKDIYDTLRLADFDFIQHDKKISYANDIIPIDGDALLTVSLLSHKLSQKPHLILLEIKMGDSNQTLLMREYLDKNAYQTIVNLSEQPGQFPFSIYFVDENMTTIHRLDGTFVVHVSGSKNDQFLLSKINNFINQHPFILILIIVLLLALLLLLILLILWINRRRKRAILIVPNEPDLSPKKSN